MVFPLQLSLCDRRLSVLPPLCGALDSHFLLMQSIDDNLGPSRRNRSGVQSRSRIDDNKACIVSDWRSPFWPTALGTEAEERWQRRVVETLCAPLGSIYWTPQNAPAAHRARWFEVNNSRSRSRTASTDISRRKGGTMGMMGSQMPTVGNVSIAGMQNRGYSNFLSPRR